MFEEWLSVDEGLFTPYYEDNEKDIDYESILENNKKIDLFSIEAINLLNKIKKVIVSETNKTLDKEKTDKIDNDFLKSLREVLIVKNKKIDTQYLINLSFVYYAIYNDTLPVYYDLMSKIKYIRYFMLDEKFYNCINKVVSFENCGIETLDQMRICYKNNIDDEFLNILNINPSFHVSFVEKGSLGTVGNSLAIENFYQNDFKKIYDLIGPEAFAKSESYALNLIAFDCNKEYTKELISINPDIVFDEECIFQERELLAENFDMNQISFFTKENKEVIKVINNTLLASEVKSYLFTYYKQLIELDPEFIMNDKINEIDGIYLCLNKNIEIPPSIFIKLTEEEKNKMIEFIKEIKISKIPSVKTYKFYAFVNKLIKKYKEQKPKQLAKKVKSEMM